MATDGILEVANKAGEEFGVDRLGAIVSTHARESLSVLAGNILGGARSFGPQFDDQTLLLIRCL